ncbi:MAG: hypothetical protein P8129_03375 [Anaerolineae bacterium]|jgi:hypothetical protein
MRRTLGTAVMLLLLVALAGGVERQGPPRLVIGASVGADFEMLAQETWAQFLQVFAHRQACFGDVYLAASPVLDGRAIYDPPTATVTVRVPGTAAMLRSGLLHEWAHHVEFQCEAHREMRAAFLAAQGLSPDTAWRPDTLPASEPDTLTAREWAAIPSEQYAEAVIEVVLGGRPVPTNVRLSREAVAVVETWARGGGESVQP